MSNYQRLISYIYTYEGGIRGKNIGFAKLETRGNQCRITVNVKKIFVGGNPVGVYLLAGQDEVKIGTLFARNGAGEFRAVVNSMDVENSGYSLDQFYGLSVHDVESAWRCYTTIWEDAVAHAAEVELADVTSEKVALKQEERAKEQLSAEGSKEPELLPISKEIEEEIEKQTVGGTAEDSAGERDNKKIVHLSREIAPLEQPAAETDEAEELIEEISEEISEKTSGEEPEEVPGETHEEPAGAQIRMPEHGGGLPDGLVAGSIDESNNRFLGMAIQEAVTGMTGPEPAKQAVHASGMMIQEAVRPIQMNQERGGRVRQRYAPPRRSMQGGVLRQEMLKPESVSPAEEAAPPVPEGTAADADPAPPSGVTAPFKDLSDICREQEVWEMMRKKYPKILAFDYADGCEVLTIKPQDIGLLPREEWIYGSNSFLLHGYYNYRYLILARLNNPEGKARYLLGVPGHYLSNEKYMASMFGFTNFVLAKKQPPRDGRFGYWYTDVKIGD